MEFSINYSSIHVMLKLCEKLKDGNINTSEVRDLLNHEDYKFELSRYKNRVSEEQFIDYFLDLKNLNEGSINNEDLKVHHRYYIYLLDNLDLLIEKEKELDKWFKYDVFEKQIQLALKGLPNDIKLPKLKFVFTIGIGQSFGYAHENGMHFDFLQLIKDKSLEEFCSTIAHEVHHVGMNLIHETIDFNALTLESLFYLYFTSEGLAVKYCNNAEGVLSKSLYEGAKNMGLDSFTWKYLNDDFENTMIQFKTTIGRIRNNEIKSTEELLKYMEEYWMNPLANDQKPGDIPRLKHFRLYTFGNDIWGVIHDCFGKEVVYETIRNPQDFITVYNKALKKLGSSISYEKNKISYIDGSK